MRKGQFHIVEYDDSREYSEKCFSHYRTSTDNDIVIFENHHLILQYF